jgi:hypothetical protein
MAANGGYRVFNTGDVLTASQVQLYLQNQTVMYFATTTARDAVLTGATLVEGMVSYVPSTGIRVYNGTSWVATGTASPLTTKGDIWGYDTTNNRIPVGTNGQVLTADSTNALGVSWQTPSSGGMTLLSTTNLSGTTTTISSINQSYINLFVVFQNPYLASSQYIRVNPNATIATVPVRILGGSTTVAQLNSIESPDFLGTTSNAAYQNIVLSINNYADSTYGKTFTWYGISNGSPSGSFFASGVFASSSAITSLAVTTVNGTATYAGGRVLVYGVK